MTARRGALTKASINLNARTTPGTSRPNLLFTFSNIRMVPARQNDARQEKAQSRPDAAVLHALPP